ncbi:MAG: hypothetical protein AAGA29_00785 [Planctomycetota bacterium]
MQTRSCPIRCTIPTRRLLAAALLVPLASTPDALAEVTTTGSVSPNPLFVTAQDNLFVGYGGIGSGPSGTMDITNGSIVASNRGFVGRAGSRVTIDGPGSRWLMFGELNIGRYGAATLDVLNGGTLDSAGAYFAGNGVHTGFVTIDGAGSTWTNDGDMSLGGLDGFNISDGFLTLSNGGVVHNTGGVLIGPLVNHTGAIIFSNGTLNTAWGLAPINALRGTGTINADHWLLYGDYTVSSAADLPSSIALEPFSGYDITLNLDWSAPLDTLSIFGIDRGSLTLNSGIDIASDRGNIHFSVGGPAAMMTIDGVGTTWTVRDTLDIGIRGEGILNITNGGAVDLGSSPAVSYDRDITLGDQADGVGRLHVQGAGSVFNANAMIEMGYEGEGHLAVSQGGAANVTGIQLFNGSLRVSDAGSSLTILDWLDVQQADGTGAELVPAVRIENGAAMEVGVFSLRGDPSNPATVLVTGAGSSLTMSDSSHIGSNGGLGVLLIEDGATVTSEQVWIGRNTRRNPPSSVRVSGAGSRWTVAGDLYLGYEGSGILSIADGAQVEVQGSLVLSRLENDLVGLGPPIVLDNGTITFGSQSSIFADDVTGVGTVNANTWLLEGNHIINSFADLPGTISVAQFAGQNLTVNLAWERGQSSDFRDFGVNNGQVTLGGGMDLDTSNSYLGYFEGAQGELILTGAATRWDAGHAIIGRAGVGTLRVENGATFEASITQIGDLATGVGSVTVTGVGTRWAVGRHYIGDFGHGTLRIEGGASATIDRVYLGSEHGSSGEIIVSGAGSAMSSLQEIRFGNESRDADGTLRVLDGASASFNSIYIPRSTGTHTIQIDGAGSQLTLNDEIFADDMSGAWLTITNGGAFLSAEENRVTGGVTIDGVGSSWQVDGDLFLGVGEAATLDLTGGATLGSHNAVVGQNRAGESGAAADVLVDGVGSHWRVDENLYLGGSTSDNPFAPGQYRGTMTIANGGEVTVGGAVLVDSGVSGSFIAFDHGTLNVGSALILAQGLRGTGTINADYWLISGDVTLSDFSALPAQLVYDQLPDQNITVNLAWSDPTQQFAFFGIDEGSVTLNNGLAISSDTGYVALTPGSDGVMTLSGAGTDWQVAGDLYAGFRGEGTLRIEGGAQLTAEQFNIGEYAGAIGLLEVSGAGSHAMAEELFMGQGGSGTLRVTDGGAVTIESNQANHFVTLGEGENTDSEIEIVGAGSRLDVIDARWMTVGYRSDSALRIEDGGAFSTTLIRLSLQHGSTGSVLVDAGTFNAADLRIGEYGNGLFELRNGGLASTPRVCLGMESQGSSANQRRSMGQARVAGTGTTWVIDDFIGVGCEGDGTLEITSGARVISHNGFVSSNDGGTGHVTVSGAGSIWESTGNLTMFEEAELRVENGGRVDVGGSWFLFEDSLVTLQLGDPATPAVTVGQDALLRGALVVEIPSGTEIEADDTFALISIEGTRTGEFFGRAENATVGSHAGLDLLLTYVAGDGNDIGLTAVLSGDVDGDHTVGTTDLDILLANWGDVVAPFDRAMGDLSGDGRVGQADLQLVAAHWGNNASNTGVVPEPASAIPLLSLLWISRRRRSLR